MEAITYQIEAEVGEELWWFQARRQILKDLLERQDLPPDPVIYDVGCGTGHNLIMLQDLGQATGIDMSPEALAYCRELGCRSTLEGSLYDLPVPDGSADVVVASDILEHLDDDARGASEIFRALKPGGLAVVTVPAFQWLWGTQDDVSHHKRRYTRPEVERLLTGAGFRLEKSTYFNCFLFPLVLFGRLAIKLSRTKLESENKLTGPRLNKILKAIFASESGWLARGGFPIGVSVLVVARKV